MRLRGGTVPRQQHRPASGRRPAGPVAIQPHILRLIVTWLSVRTPCSSRSSPWPPCIRHAACGLRSAWIRRSHVTRPRGAMRRIVQSHTEGSTHESNHGRPVVSPATRLGGEVRAAAPALETLPALAPGVRPCVRGKFLFVGDEKLYVRGVTYGAFPPDAAGNEYHDLATVRSEEHTSELQSPCNLVCRLLLEKKKK